MNRSSLAATGLVVFILGFARVGRADADTIRCPPTITVKEALAAPQTGWQAYDLNGSGTYTFYGAMFSEGPPDARVILTPARLNHTKREKTETYDMTAVAFDNLWLTCLYRDTSVTLTKKLEGSFRECRITYDPTTGFETVLQVDCRK
ncbi:MAG: STY0301 family protein [Spirochaetia bacterium]